MYVCIYIYTYLKAWVLPLISRDIHSGLYVVMSPLIQHNMARSLPQDLYQQGRQARPSQHSQILPAVIIIWQWLSRVMPPSRPGGGRGGGEFPLSPHPSLPLVLGSYPLLASSPHSYQRKFGIVRAGSEDGPLPREGRTQHFQINLFFGPRGLKR